jgi:hypothetical protein
MLHFKETLDAEQRQSLLAYLAERLRVEATVHRSHKPHLLFVPADPTKATPHRIVDAVRKKGYDVRLVDL